MSSLRDSARASVQNASPVRIPMAPITGLINNAYRAGRHVAVWLLWHSTGVSMLPPVDSD